MTFSKFWKNVNEQLKDNKLEKFATACDTAGTKMESFGKKMSVVSAGIAGIGAASIAAFKELDEGYDTIVTKTGATGEALEGLTKSADNVFGTMPEDMSTVGEAIGEVNTRFMLWTERRWSEQSETFISPENPSMYSLNSYKSIQTKKRTASGNGCRPCVIMDL